MIVRKKTFAAVFAAALLVLSLCGALAEDTVSLYGKNYPLNARKIDFGSTAVTDLQPLLDALPLFTQLEEVDLYESKLTVEDMQKLYTAAPQLHWGLSLEMAAHHIRSDIESFSTLHSPRAVLYPSELYYPIRFCWRLKALDLGHNKITTLDFLENLTELRYLILAVNRIDDISLLANLTKLEYLEIDDNDYISDLSPLASCRNLMDLNIATMKKVKDVSVVLELPNLRRMWFSSSKNQMPERKAIQEELESRGVKVVMNPYYFAVGSGWREDPHYDVIYETFNTYTFVPFEDSKQ